MELNPEEQVLQAYGLRKENFHIKTIGTGLINRTYLLLDKSGKSSYILQNINTSVFTRPEIIAHNLKNVGNYLQLVHPDYLFIRPIQTTNGEEMALIDKVYWRLLPYIANAIALEVLNAPEQGYEAAKQFGKFSRMLSGFDASLLTPSIPAFHDLNLRFEQFELALKHTSTDLKFKSAKEITQALHYQSILNEFNLYRHRNDFPDRVMHHDTKISNVLLDADTFNGVCVIDLDTIMPGKFISDLGDMMRTYLSAYSENETDLTKINIRIAFFEATMKGYLSEMRDVLTTTEKELILFSGKYMIYMQALRFLTDYLNGNVYYSIRYSDQNLDRAKNQFRLLEELILNEVALQAIIDRLLS